MLFLLLLSVLLTNIWTVSGESDEQCKHNCTCCIDYKCGQGRTFTDACLHGCIDGHRGERCYELCQYKNCKSCGGTGDLKQCTQCYDGYILGQNNDCTLECPSTCKLCTSSTNCIECKKGFYNKNGSTACQYAYCPTNCDCTIGQSDCKSCKKGFYDNSTLCNKQCSDNCLTCKSQESCNECKNGFYNGYDNNASLQLNNCSFACRDTCARCQSYNNCLQCIKGKYGIACLENCSVGCWNGTCLFESGHCECSMNFTGDKCSDCVNGTYGVYCNQTCSKYCKGKNCEKTTGFCVDGCTSTNMTGNNCSACIKGMYGESCNKECPENCKNNMCGKYSGNCSEGCIENFNGTICDICIHGKYGENCEENCPSNCGGGICEKGSGECYDCTENFQGKTCKNCTFGFYGSNCKTKCPQYCNATICDRNTGKCTFGCTSNYSGDRCCVKSDYCEQCKNNIMCQKCASGFFNISCNEKCPQDCPGSCEILTGECDECQYNRFGKYCEMICSNSCNFEDGFDERACARYGGKCIRCKDGFFHPTCNETCSSLCVGRTCRQDDGVCIQKEGQTGEPPNIAGPIAGGVGALILIVAGVFVSIFFYRRRKIGKNSRNERIVNDTLSSNMSGERVETVEERTYVNIKDKRVPETDPEFVVLDKSNNGDEHSVNTNFKVADLISYVTKDRFDSFENEFKNLPKPGDLSTVCKIARKAENIASNRYNGIYPCKYEDWQKL